MKIYILVEVDYDYFRFQTNICASTDKELLKARAEFINDEGRKVYDYATVDDTPLYVKSQEIRHYWIQELPDLATSL